MQKYSENPLDNLQGYLENIERVVEELATKSAEGNSTASDSEKIATLKEDVSSIRATIGSLRSEINTLSDAVNTVAAAIGTVPTEEERNKQHQEDLEYIVNNAKKQVTVGLDESANMRIFNMSSQVQELANAISDAETSFSRTIDATVRKVEEPLKKMAVNFEERIGKTVEKKAEKTLNKASAAVIENWVWRVLTTVGVIAWFITWLYPKIEDIEFPNGVEGFFYTILGVISITFILWGTYQWGKNSRGW